MNISIHSYCIFCSINSYIIFGLILETAVTGKAYFIKCLGDRRQIFVAIHDIVKCKLPRKLQIKELIVILEVLTANWCLEKQALRNLISEISLFYSNCISASDLIWFFFNSIKLTKERCETVLLSPGAINQYKKTVLLDTCRQVIQCWH